MKIALLRKVMQCCFN